MVVNNHTLLAVRTSDAEGNIMANHSMLFLASAHLFICKMLSSLPKKSRGDGVHLSIVLITHSDVWVLLGAEGQRIRAQGRKL